MNHIDLFSGIGGFALAANWTWQQQHKILQFVEIDKFCQKVLRKNFGEIPIHDDIKTFSAKSFRGKCDLLTGGFPCQPFSNAGKQLSRKDERHLFPQMLRVISEVKPRWIVAENVRRILTIENGAVFAEIVTSLESQGYEVITFCLPASAVEAWHERQRVWVIAHNNSEGLERRKNSSAVNWKNKRIQPWAENSRDELFPTFTNNNSQRELQPQGIVETFGEWISDSNKSNVTNSSNFGCKRRRCEKQARRKEFDSNSFDVTDASSKGFQNSRFEEFGKCKTKKGKRLERRFKFQNSESSSDIDGIGSCKNCENDQTRFSNQADDLRRIWHGNPIEYALRTCVRGNIYGLSSELDFIGSRDNRQNRIKALGNAIVPQVAYEIFQAIKEVENYAKLKS